MPRGVTFRLEGDANDYWGKGLSGGRLIVFPPRQATFRAEENIVIGNVALYGATAGEVFVRGVAGERFGVRNSGAHAVVEGIGDHGGEYMTGGIVVVIGPTGRNFGAGMSGGIAFIWDPENTFVTRFNSAMADLKDVESGSPDESGLRTLLERHAHFTGSTVATHILADWEHSRTLFKK